MNLFNFCKTKKRNFSLFSSGKMVRQKSRKTLEELYAAAPPPPPSATHRFDEHFLQNPKNSKYHKVNGIRKKSKGPVDTGHVENKDEKTFMNEETLFGKANKSKKPDLFTSSALDNKDLMNFVDETEKDEDTEEFFQLIKQTVVNAVGKTLSDILNRNFREVSAKIDDLRDQLHVHETKLEKIKADVNSKIVHYGEENSRHFRYLCMKSEYDKMFYQHQNVMTAMPVDPRPNAYTPQFSPPQPSQQDRSSTLPANSQQTPMKQCSCQNTGGGDFDSVERSKSSVSTKSSETGIKEVKDLLEQLQKFYENQKADEDSRKQVKKGTALDVHDDSGDGDEDDDSSDDLSSTSIEEKLGSGGDC